MGSKGSVPPSDGLPLVNAYGVLGMAWGALGIIARTWPQRGSPLAIFDFLSWATVELLGLPALEPLDHREFYTRSSFSEKAPSERVGHLLRAEDGRAFLGGFLGEAKRVLQWPWQDGTFHPQAGAVNATYAHARLARRKRK
jgi:hypothetical protein